MEKKILEKKLERIQIFRMVLPILLWIVIRYQSIPFYGELNGSPIMDSFNYRLHHSSTLTMWCPISFDHSMYINCKARQNIYYIQPINI
jgi:hypothetical protein